MKHTQDVALSCSSSRYLFYHEKVESDDGWRPSDFRKHVQSHGDLGKRMAEAFSVTLAEQEKAIIIGSDCPEITTEIIEDAYDRLDLADVVIGPTLDGGYYLLGMKAEHRFLFENMAWSTETVFTDTKDKIISANLLYSVMPTLSDLDNIDDLRKFPHLSE